MGAMSAGKDARNKPASTTSRGLGDTIAKFTKLMQNTNVEDGYPVKQRWGFTPFKQTFN